MERKKIKNKKNKVLFETFNRRSLLSNTTDAEKAACKILSSLNIRYIKQYPINTGKKIYYADIYIPQLRLILEIDGGYHYTPDQKRKDENRSSGIRRLGLHVYRLSNKDARSLQRVKAKILRRLRDMQTNG